MLGRVRAFFDERFGFAELMRQAYDEQIEGGPRWGYVFFNAFVVMFVVQALTGALLMLTYTPEIGSAWSSVFYIQHRVTNGWFVRGMHAWGAQAMLLVLAMHMVQSVWYGAYKKPREGNFWVLLALLHLVLGALISGLRLPWDQLSYWALWVELNIAASMPVIGQPLYELIAGGPVLGQSTLTRLYTIHVIVLPVIMFKMIFLMWWMKKKHGRALPEWVKPEGAGRAWPGQWARDLVFVVGVLGAVAVVTAMVGGGAELESPADPYRDFPARPEWFILPLFKLRKLFPASLEIVATAVIPGAIVTFFAALPFLDRKVADKPMARIKWVAPFAVLGLGLAALTQMSYADDAADEEYQESRAAADVIRDRSIELAGWGIPPEGPLAMLANDPMTRGREVYAQYCSSCHVLSREGEREAPDHTGMGSRQWLIALMHAPQDDHFFGLADLDERMPRQNRRISDEELEAIAELLYSWGREDQDPDDVDHELAESGRRKFESKCMSCHVYEGDGDFDGTGGPNLTGYGSRTWIFRQIDRPESETQYGELNDMPAFNDQLSPHDIRMATAFLRLQRFEDIDFEPGDLEEAEPEAGADAEDE